MDFKSGMTYKTGPSPRRDNSFFGVPETAVEEQEAQGREKNAQQNIFCVVSTLDACLPSSSFDEQKVVLNIFTSFQVCN